MHLSGWIFACLLFGQTVPGATPLQTKAARTVATKVVVPAATKLGKDVVRKVRPRPSLGHGRLKIRF